MSSSVNSGLFGVNQLYEQLINNLITYESKRKFSYEDQKVEQEARKTAISSVGSKLTSLNSTLSDFASTSNNLFELYAAKSTNESAFTLTNTSRLSTSGTYSLDIQQTAKADVRVSQRLVGTGNDIATAITSATGDDELSFTINVNGNSYTINSDEATGLSNHEFLYNLATTINDTAGADVQASILRETSGSVRLSIRSKQSGEDSAISFSNTIDGDGLPNLAEFLQLTVDNAGPTADDNSTVLPPSSLNGGRLFALNTLNAKFTIDGLNFERASNVVSDAITGLSISLKQVTASTESIEITADNEGALTNVNKFIDSYNAVITEIRTKSFLNSTSGDRGPLYKDRSFKELSNTLRQVATSISLDSSIVVASPPTLPPGIKIQTILDIGIKINQDGTLAIGDQTKLNEILSTNPDAVKALFSSDRADSYKGIASKLQDSIDLFIKSDGLVSSLTSSIDSRIKQLNDRISSQDTFLEKRRIQLRNQFIQLQAISDQASSQYQTLSRFQASYG